MSDALAAGTIDLLRQADISVCVLPTRIRLTRVLELMETGVNVACGTDNVRDPFVRFGDADPFATRPTRDRYSGIRETGTRSVFPRSSAVRRR